MKRFQKKRGLHVDGVARPGGPTETNLNSALAEGLTQVRPVNAPSKPARRDEDDETRAAFGATPKKTDRPRNPQRSPLGVSPKRPKVFDVSAGVGQGQLNGRYDVRGAKHTLAWAGYYPKDKAQSADGRVDADLTWGIWDFQRDHKLKRDGYMLPGGETATALNALVAPLVRAAFGAAERPDQATGFQESRDAEEPPAEDPPARTPEDGGGSDEGEGDDQEEPDTDHGRKCAAHQRQVRELWREEVKYNEAMHLLGKDISETAKGAERNQYVAYVVELTDYVHRPSRRDRIREGDFPGLGAGSGNPDIEIAGVGLAPRKGRLDPIPPKTVPPTQPGPAPAPPGGGGRKPPVMAPPFPMPGDGGEEPSTREDPNKGDRDPSNGVEGIIDWLTEPDWFDDIRKFNIRARDAAATRAREAHDKRLRVIVEAIDKGCQIDEMPSLGPA
jgi:peptidoglycan hydrolase-like protein with peptidoglycan-binding domain